MNLCQLIQKRKSCRAFTDQPVTREIVRCLLETAKWAPSGVNHQPTQVAVLGPETKKRLSARLVERFDQGISPNPDYEFCPNTWSDLYQERRKACGNTLYQALGISREDSEGRKIHKRRNYDFFGAPVGMIVFIEKGMPKGSWMDVGMFIQNLLLAAEEMGLAACPQATFAEYPDAVREILALKEVDIICGIALGYEDLTHPLNSYRTEREPVDRVARWYR